MAKAYLKVDASNLKEMLERFHEVTGKSVPLIVRANARICARELANRTQLFSVGKSGGRDKLKEYTGYLKRDILKAVKDTDKLNEKAASIADAGLRERLQAVIAKGNPVAIGAMLKAVGTIADASNFKPVSGPSEIKAIHAPNRSKRTGRALSTRPEYYYAKGGIQTYVNQVAKKLGYTKSGWAECARKIGGLKGDGARGIPAWAKRHKAENFQVKDNSGNEKDPHFIMTNTTPWVSRLIPPRDQDDASNIARQMMEKQLDQIMKRVSKQKINVKALTAEILAESNE